MSQPLHSTIFMEKQYRKVVKLITRLNILTKVLADIFSPEEYWNQNTIIDYVKHLYSKRLIIGVTDEESYDRIIDSIQIAGARSIIDEKWRRF